MQLQNTDCSDWSSVINSVIHLSLGDLTED